MARRKGSPEGEDFEQYEDESSVFQRRREWFGRVLGERDGSLSVAARLLARDQAARLRPPPLEAIDPGGDPPKRGHQLIIPAGVKARARRGKNPRPGSSFGFVGPIVEVAGDDDLRGSVLKVALDQDQEDVALSTVRTFRYEEATGEWALVPRSGVSPDRRYAYAHLRRPGTYALVGLPTNPWLQATVSALEVYRPWLNAARTLDRLPDALERICQLILCQGPFEEVVRNRAAVDKLGLPPFGPGDPGNVCERCLGLDPPSSGLPEAEIVRELSTLSVIDTIIIWPPWWWCSSWTSQGPANINGRIKSLAVDPTNGTVIYAGAADGGVWKTTDGGASWYPTMRLELSMAIGAVAVAPSSPNVVYAATGEDTPGWAPSFPGVGVYKTTDGGADWDLTSPISSTRCTRVLVHPANPNILYVAGDSGLHKSTDGGATWTTVLNGHASDALLDPNTPNTLYVAIWGSGVFKSIDAGTTWVQLTNGLLTGSAADWIKLAMGLGGTDGTAYLLAKMGADSGLIFESSDAGATWTQLPGTHHPVAYNEWTSVIAVSPANQDVIFAGGVGYSRSTDGGTTFTSIGGTHSDHHQIVFDPGNSNVLFMATDGGVYRSADNGATWTVQSAGLVATQLYSLGVSQTNPLLLGGGTQDQGVIRSTGATAWADTGAGNEGGFFIVDPNDADNVYVTPWSGNLRRSTDGAVTWTTILNGLGTPAPTVEHLAIRPGDSNQLLCAAGATVFRSTDQGTTWSGVLTPTASPRQVAFAPSNSAIAYTATSTGQVYRTGGAGAAGSWSEPYAAADRPPTGSINALVVGWNDPDYVAIGYAGSFGPKIYITEDGGTHWHDAGGVLATDALPDTPVTSLVFHPSARETIYAATAVGVFRTRDGGDSWEPYDDGMPRIVTTQLALRRSTYTLYASTMGRGAYRRSV
jgi:hypothetical protein